MLPDQCPRDYIRLTPLAQQKLYGEPAKAGVPRELFAAILDRIQPFEIPPPLVQRG